MEQSIQMETGAQLLTRLMRRPSLQGLENVLFLDGPRQNEVVEISGNFSSGKTFLLTQLLVKCLMPQTYEDHRLNGLGAGAVIVNTDHHFQISILANLMMNFIHNVTKDERTGSKVLDDAIVANVIKNSLRNLIVVNCYESAQFLLGLQSLEAILSKDDKIALVAIDSISAFYWQDREIERAWSMDGYHKDYLKIIQKYTFEHKVILLYTRPSKFESKGKETVDCATAPQEEKVNYRIQLHKCERTKKFIANVESAIDKRSISYSINDYGIEWQNEL